jgi:hypothetical protein
MSRVGRDQPDFLERQPQGWSANIDAAVALPWIDPALVRTLPAGADS